MSWVSDLYENEVKCLASDIKMICHSHARNTHFHKKVNSEVAYSIEPFLRYMKKPSKFCSKLH